MAKVPLDEWQKCHPTSGKSATRRYFARVAILPLVWWQFCHSKRVYVSLVSFTP